MTDQRKADGKFAKGNAGKPKGARHKTTRAIQDMLDGQSEAITNAAIGKALAGDPTALRLCLERLAPPKKDAPVCFDLPALETIADAAQAARAILAAVAEGELTPLEGATVMALVEAFRKTLETADIERRLIELEKAK